MKINKQILLSVGAITGMCCAIGAAVYATPKAKELADKYKDDKVEAAKRVAPLYIPTLLSFIAASGCVFAKDYIYRKELLALTASTAATTSYLAANRDKIKKVLDKNPKIKDFKKALLPTKDELKHQTIEETGNGDLLCFESYLGRPFRSSIEAVQEAEDKVSELYLDEEDNGEFGYACLNDFYGFLNIQRTQGGHDFGWVNNEDWYPRNESIGFKNTMIPADAPGNEWGEEIYCIEFNNPCWYPMQGWQEL